MDYRAHCEAIERETRSISDAFRRGAGAMDATVPTCPEWMLRDLAKHVGEFTGLWTHVLCEGTGREKTPYSDIPEDAAIADWYAELARHLLGELAATPADTEVWTWVPTDRTARFVARRCANELAVHRFDAQTGTGGPDPIDGPLAADGIDEIFVMIPAWGNTPDGSGRSLHLHATDHPHEWTITMTPDGLDVRREHGDADLTLSGATSDLELVLFQRPPIGPVDRDGDEAALDAWYREFHFG